MGKIKIKMKETHIKCKWNKPLKDNLRVSKKAELKYILPKGEPLTININ